jgi:hypothetical protein
MKIGDVEVSTSHGEYPISGTDVTIHGSNGPVPGKMNGGQPVPNQ